MIKHIMIYESSVTSSWYRKGTIGASDSKQVRNICVISYTQM